jgi:hypothetical protein
MKKPKPLDRLPFSKLPLVRAVWDEEQKKYVPKPKEEKKDEYSL